MIKPFKSPAGWCNTPRRQRDADRPEEKDVKPLLHLEILEIMKKRARTDHEYVNPNFLQEITKAIERFYQCNDKEVDKWVADMFRAQHT